MSRKVKPKMAPISRILDHKVGGEDEILFPTPVPFIWQGRKYKIKPMPDRVLKTLSAEFNQVTNLFMGVAATLNRDVPAGEEPPPITPAALLPYLPEVLSILLPSATTIIAGCLRVDEELIADEMSLGKKTECLRLIFESEDLPLLMANFPGLMGMFNSFKAKPEMNTGTGDETGEGDEDEAEED